LYPNYVHLSWSVPENPITFYDHVKLECYYFVESRWVSEGSWHYLGTLDSFEFRILPYFMLEGDWTLKWQTWTTWHDFYFPALYFTEMARDGGICPGEDVSFRVSARSIVYWPTYGIGSPPSNVVTVNIGWVTPTIKEIKVTGIPDTNNPTTNCPSTAVDEKVKLEAKIDCSEHFQIIKYSWSGEDVKSGEGNPYEYEAAPGPGGKKNVRCTITYRNVEYGWTGTDTKTKEFKLFFVKDGYDNGAGQPPNWFTYWSEIITPSLLGSPKPRMVYSGKSYFWMGENVIHLSAGDGGTYSAPEGLHNPLEGIDNFVWSAVHESQHYTFDCDYWGNNWANYLTHYGKDGPNDDKDGDLLPNYVEDTNLNKQWDPLTEKYNWSQLLTPGAPAGITNDDEWKNCFDNRGVTGAAYYEKDFANPGKQTTAGGAMQVQLASAGSPAGDGLPDVVQVVSPNATFNRAYSDHGLDLDGDGLYEVLQLGVGVNVTASGFYVVSGGLKDSSGNVWCASNESHLDVGLQSVSLRFDGLNIHGARVNGPFELVDLVLSDQNSGLHDCVSNACTTSAYQYGEFEGSATWFTGVFSDHGTDTDGDGVYNRLTVDVGVNSTVSANCTVEAWLCDNGGTVITGARDTEFVNVGSSMFALDFDGLPICSSRVDGPYSVKYLSLRYENGSQVDFIYDAYNTSALSYTSFRGGNAWFTGAYENRTENVRVNETGLPTGLFDYLIVGVNVTVNVAGNYGVAGSLCDCNGTEIGDACSFGFLNSSAIPEVFLTFSGFPIHENGVDGPYTLSHLTLYDENGTILDTVSHAYNTSAYKHTEFTNIPEFSMPLILPTFVITTLVAVAVWKRTRKRPC
jgi:hypothetical protein